MNEDKHKLPAAKCRSMIPVSRNIRYIRDIREGSSERAGKRLFVVEERNFHRLLLAICTETIDMIYRIYNAVYTIYSPSTAFQWSQMHDLERT